MTRIFARFFVSAPTQNFGVHVFSTKNLGYKFCSTMTQISNQKDVCAIRKGFVAQSLRCSIYAVLVNNDSIYSYMNFKSTTVINQQFFAKLKQLN